MAMVAKICRYATRTRGFIPDSIASFDVMFMPAYPSCTRELAKNGMKSPNIVSLIL